MGLDRERIEEGRSKYGQNNNGRLDRPLGSTARPMRTAAIVILTIGVMLILFSTVAMYFILFGGLDRLPFIAPLTGHNVASPSPSPAWHDHDGNINIDTDRLARTDPIVAIWQSRDAVFDNWQVYTDNFILIFYNDYTYELYDRNNSSYKKGTWAKPTAQDNFYRYTLNEGTLMPYPEKLVGYPSQGSFQITFMEEGTPPHLRLSYINYQLVDYYPLQPGTIAKINERA